MSDGHTPGDLTALYAAPDTPQPASSRCLRCLLAMPPPPPATVCVLPSHRQLAHAGAQLLQSWDCGCPGEHHQYCARYVPPPIHIPEELVIVNRRKCGCLACKRIGSIG